MPHPTERLRFLLYSRAREGN